MKKITKNILTSALALVMVLSAVLSFSVSTKAANLPFPTTPISWNVLSVEDEYTGSLPFTWANTYGDAWSSDYMNYDYSYAQGEKFLVSFTLNNADLFQQVAVQSSVNDWDWVGAAKIYMSGGIASGTKFAGIIEATHDIPGYDPEVDPYPPYMTLKIQLDNWILGSEDIPDYASVDIEIADFKVTPFTSNPATEITGNPMAPGLENLYSGTVYAGPDAERPDTWSAYLHIDTNYVENDEFFVFYKIAGASDFKQVSVQSDVNDWIGNPTTSVWGNDGIPDGQVGGGIYSASKMGSVHSIRLDFDNPLPSFENTTGILPIDVQEFIIVQNP